MQNIDTISINYENSKFFFNFLVQIQKICIFAVRKNRVRDVAQPGSALRSGRRGRKFESCHPDKKQLF